MAIPSTGTISLNDVQTEFLGSNPIAINEYYKADLGVPTSGTISLNDLRGKTRHATKTEIATFFASPGGVYRRDADDSGAIGTPVLKYGSFVGGGNLAAETHLFTPSLITGTVAANLKHCVENTVVWFFVGDGSGINSAITAHEINENGITIGPTYNTRVIGAFGDSSRTLCQFSAYNTASTVGTSARLTAITSASCTFPQLGTNNAQVGGAFLLPGKWTAVVPYASFLTSNNSVTLDHGDICLVGWGSSGNPANDGNVPFNASVNILLSETAGGVNHILPNFAQAKEFDAGVSGFLFYANLSGSTRTYSLPATITYPGSAGTNNMFKHYMILKFAPDQYYGQQS